MRRVTALVALFSLLSLQSCELLGQVGNQIPTANPLPPELALNDIQLTGHPSATDVAAWYCPEILPALACNLAVGPPPPEFRMQFHFELKYLIDNPNNFPVPTTEILAAIEVFRGFNAAELGAVCVVLCNPGDFACTGEPGANDCKSDVADITSIEDVPQAIARELLILATEAASGNFDGYVRREIPAAAKNYEINIRFSLGLNAMIDIMRTLVDQLVQDFSNGREVAFEIPVSVYGTLWFEIPFLGRVAAGYGPFDDVWRLEP